MSSGRLEIELGGKYTARQQFQQMNADLKAAGKSMKDMGQAATSVASSIAGSFDMKLNGTLKTSLNLFQELARGGIWGALQVAITSTIGFVADKFKEAKEQAKALGEALDKHVAAAFKKISGDASTNLADVKSEMAEATKEADALLAALNGKVADSAKVQIAQLHVETLQKMTDATSEAGKQALAAQEAFTAAVLKSNAAMDQANNAAAIAEKKLGIAKERLAAAREAEATTAESQKRLEERYATVLQTQTTLKWQIAQILETSVNNEQYANENAERLATLRERLSTLEGDYGSVLAQITQGRKDVAAREADVSAAEIELTASHRAVTAANRRIEVVRNENAAAEAEAKAKRDAANAALEKETAASKAATKAAEKKAEQEAIIDKIRTDAIEKDIEYTEWVELARKALESGMEAETTLALVKRRYAMAMEERAKQEESARASGPAGGGETPNPGLVKAIKQGVSESDITTNVNAGGVGDGVDQSDEVITMGDLERDVRDDQRKSRNHMSAVRQSNDAVQKYLEGKMSPEVAAKFEQKIKANGWTSKDIGKAYEKALKATLLSDTQQKNQYNAIIKMSKALEKLGLK